MLYLRYLYNLILISGLCLTATAQPLLFENYSSKHGLSQHNCTSISQENNGFIWIATADGLNRYDGRNFRVYLQQNQIGKKLPSNFVFSLQFDSLQQMMWIGTAKGICFYVSEGDSLAAASDVLPYASLLDSVSTRKIFSFNNYEFWVLTSNRGLIYVNTKKRELQFLFTKGPDRFTLTDMVYHQGKTLVAHNFKFYSLERDEKTGQYQAIPIYADYNFPQIRSLASTGNRLWIGTISDGCYYIDDKPGEPGRIVATDLIFGGIEAMGKGNNNDLWIYTRGSGIYRINTVTGEVDHALQDQFDQKAPLSNFGACVFTDRQGLVWLGASGGVIKYDTLNSQFLTINGASSQNSSLTDNAIYCMLRTRDGKHFVGTQGKGIFQWDISRDAFKSYPGTAVVYRANNVIYSLTEDDQGRIWAASCGGLMQLNPETGTIRYYYERAYEEPLNKLYAIIKLRHADSLLVGTDDGVRFFACEPCNGCPIPFIGKRNRY